MLDIKLQKMYACLPVGRKNSQTRHACFSLLQKKFVLEK